MPLTTEQKAARKRDRMIEKARESLKRSRARIAELEAERDDLLTRLNDARRQADRLEDHLSAHATGGAIKYVNGLQVKAAELEAKRDEWKLRLEESQTVVVNVNAENESLRQQLEKTRIALGETEIANRELEAENERLRIAIKEIGEYASGHHADEGGHGGGE